MCFDFRMIELMIPKVRKNTDVPDGQITCKFVVFKPYKQYPAYNKICIETMASTKNEENL
jgi:hypothetical protein